MPKFEGISVPRWQHGYEPSEAFVVALKIAGQLKEDGTKFWTKDLKARCH